MAMVRVALLGQRAATNCGIALFMISRSPRAISLPLSTSLSLSLSLVPSRTCCVCWLNLDTLNFHYILMEITHLFMAPSMDDADTEIASSSPPSPFHFPSLSTSLFLLRLVITRTRRSPLPSTRFVSLMSTRLPQPPIPLPLYNLLPLFRSVYYLCPK